MGEESRYRRCDHRCIMLLLLTQLRARERRIIPFLPPPRQHPPSNHRDPFSTSTVPTSPITL